MNDKNNKISEILEKYKSSFSKNDLLNLESLLSNDLGSIKRYSLFTDGACEFDDEYKPINAGIGGVIKSDNEIIHINIYSDSELVVKQINGEYKVKNERMGLLFKKTHELLSRFDFWKINHVLRDKNTEADELSKQGLSK